jgi:plastocyanin
MKKLIALFALAVLMGQGCAAQNQTEEPTGTNSTMGTESERLEVETDEPTQADTTPQEESGQVESDIDEQPIEEVEEKSATQTDEDNDVNAADEAAIQTVDMKSGNFFFEPPSITAQAGQKIEVTFTENTGFHTFVIDELDVNEQVKANKTITFTAPEEPGSYAFYCDVGNHRAAGMEGVLTVE